MHWSVSKNGWPQSLGFQEDRNGYFIQMSASRRVTRMQESTGFIPKERVWSLTISKTLYWYWFRYQDRREGWLQAADVSIMAWSNRDSKRFLHAKKGMVRFGRNEGGNRRIGSREFLKLTRRFTQRRGVPVWGSDLGGSKGELCSIGPFALNAMQCKCCTLAGIDADVTIDQLW